MAKNVTNYRDLVTQIKSELQRNDPDINTIIENAITDAIRHFKDECFAINQASTTLTASKYDSDNFSDLNIDPFHYAFIKLPDDFSSMISLQLNKDGTMYDMVEVTYPEIEDMDALITETDATTEKVTKTPHTGTPQYYAYFGTTVNDSAVTGTPGRIRIFPQADVERTLYINYVSNLKDPKDATAVSPDTVAGCWMNEAQRMIKTYAKGIIYADYLQQYEQAQAQEVMSQAEFNRLVGRSESRAFNRSVTGYI